MQLFLQKKYRNNIFLKKEMKVPALMVSKAVSVPGP